MKRFLIIALSVVGMTTAGAQETTPLPAQEGVGVTLGADLVNQYIWRGQDLGSVSLQPTLGVAWKGLSLSAWGSVGITRPEDDKELDLTLSYERKGFSIGVIDYWFSKGSYFQYHAHKTTHIWEGYFGYDFGFLSATWYTNFAGNDGLNGSDKRAYSSYFELNAPFCLAKLDWTGTVGIVPWRTTSYDTNGFACTNVSLRATKNFLIKEKYHLPVFAGLTSNPCSGKFYFIFGIGFSLHQLGRS